MLVGRFHNLCVELVMVSNAKYFLVCSILCSDYRSDSAFVVVIVLGTEASLGKPDVFQQRIVVATDCSESSNYLLFVDGEEMFKLRSDRLAMAVHPLTQVTLNSNQMIRFCSFMFR